MTNDSLTNLVSAFSLRISDRLTELTDDLMPRHETGRAVAYIGRTTGCSVRHLSQYIGLSHAATVRLVDRLSEDGLAERSSSKTDGRAVELTLTRDGARLYREMLRMTSDDIERALIPLSANERELLALFIAKLLAFWETSPTVAAQGCRFCDVKGCPDCPVTAAVKQD